jgi:pimeloyl-ACP methyl ester carboxylesterase
MPSITYNGAALFYREAGAGPPLLLLPGNTASSACHAGELAHFGRHYRTLVLDLPGTGRSSRLAVWPRDWWAAGAVAALALLDALEIERCALMGTSGGSAVALLAALAAPDRCAAVIADSLVPRFPPAPLQALLAERAVRSPGQHQFWAQAHGDDWADVVDADTAMLAAHAATGIDYFGDRLGSVGCPVLLTASLADPLLPEVGPQLCAMARALPQALLFFTNVGDHPLMWSRPDDFRLVADAFLQKVWPVSA